MKPLVTESIEALRPYSAGKPLEELARERGVTSAIKLASNENPLGPSPLALEAISRAATLVHRYPDANAYVLRQRLARHLGVMADEIVFGNGSNELIELVLRTFATGEHHVVYAHPSFVVYEMACACQGLASTSVALREQTHDLDAMLAAVRPNTRVVFIANPNNPTGTYVSRDALAAFLSALPKEVIAVVDEAYFEYATAPDYPDALSLRDLHERLIVLRTFSKAYGLAGLRIGYAVAPPHLCDYMNRVRAPFNANSLAQAAAVAALDDAAHLERCRRENTQERTRVSQAISELGLTVVPSEANFVLVDFGAAAEPWFEELLNLGVVTRPVGPLPTALRISIGTPEENTRLLRALREVQQRERTG